MSDAATWSLVLTTPLAAEGPALTALDGTETLSEPFLFTLEAKSPGNYLDPAALVGKAAGVTLIDGRGAQRHIHGLVTRLRQDGSGCVIELRPWLWQLAFTRDNRIFQNKSVPDILAAVFAAYDNQAHKSALVLTYAPLDYCVQYAESDLDFVSRLMEEAGIAYYFEYSADAHTLVLVDDPGKFPPCPNAATLPWLVPGGGDWLSDHRVESLELVQSMAAETYQATDYNFRTPATSLLAKAGKAGRTVYDYPGNYTAKADGDSVAKRRAEELGTLAAQLRGRSPVRHLTAGTTVTLSGHPAANFNGKFALYSVTHHAERRGYNNEFTAFPAATPFRQPRRTPQPRIAGSQTAIVTGPAGKEIWTDEYGRIKVQFHWDRAGQNDDKSSCWIRVAQSWAGTSWGAFTLPRVGQEVVVSFLDGNPDRPLVTGCVYNGDNPVPYALPDGQSRSTLKSQSTPGASGFNEIRFEDKAGEEELFVQAQKDLLVTVLNNSTETVKQDRAVTVEEGNATLTISKGNWTTSVATGDASHSVKGKLKEEIGGDAQQSVTGNLTIEVTGNVTIKSSGTVTVEATGALSLKGATVEITASASATIDGGGALNLKGGLDQAQLTGLLLALEAL